MSARDADPPGLTDKSRRVVGNNAIKDSINFTKYSCETNGEYTECLVTLNAGGGNPLHYHTKFTETFDPISGKLGLQLENEEFHIKKGQKITVQKTQRHRFFNDSSDSIEFRIVIAPGSPGFEQSIYLGYGLANDGLTDDNGGPKSFLHLCIFASLGDLNLPGWAGLLLRPILPLGSWYARWSGLEDTLLEKYYR